MTDGLEKLSGDAEHFEYLDSLRKSGITNMFGAAPYVATRFSLDIGEARHILSEWMKRFGARNDRVPPDRT